MTGVLLWKPVHRDSLTVMWQRGIGKGRMQQRRRIFCAAVLTEIHIQPCFSIREANMNKCVSMIYIHKHTENHTKQTVDISHQVCHNVARQIAGIK